MTHCPHARPFLHLAFSVRGPAAHCEEPAPSLEQWLTLLSYSRPCHVPLEPLPHHNGQHPALLPPHLSFLVFFLQPPVQKFSHPMMVCVASTNSHCPLLPCCVLTDLLTRINAARNRSLPDTPNSFTWRNSNSPHILTPPTQLNWAGESARPC